MNSFHDQLKEVRRQAAAKQAAATALSTTATPGDSVNQPQEPDPSIIRRPPDIDAEAWSALPDDLKAELAAGLHTATSKRPRSPPGAAAPNPSSTSTIDTISFGSHPYIRELMERGQVTLRPTTPKYFSGSGKRLGAESSQGAKKRPKTNGLSNTTAISLLSDSDDDDSDTEGPVILPLLTQNLWFDSTCQELRMRHLKKTYFSSGSPFVACQELTGSLLQHLSSSSSSYSIHDQQIQQSPRSGVGSDLRYGCAMLFPKSRAPTVMGSFMFVKSKMTRGLTFGIVENVLLASTHLESFNGPRDPGQEFRALQVVEFKEFVEKLVSLKLIKAAAVMGDMNWDDEKAAVSKRALGDTSMAKLLGGEWIDAYRNLYSVDAHNGYTYDGNQNAMLSSNGFRRRFDRILLYPANKVEVSKVEIVGREVIEGGERVLQSGKRLKITGSDHFGLRAVVKFDI
ncbi:hypothetical protein TrST_g7895 [Triparma strigata]|uniref:Uncharacterized protein n=1 Tax=Triparma strigata TaxID=1606541 RepID=A0A9W7EI89_9STRA|nr:hypothetical protein TrST_g7895 [Triparma strigata]